MSYCAVLSRFWRLHSSLSGILIINTSRRLLAICTVTKISLNWIYRWIIFSNFSRITCKLSNILRVAPWIRRHSHLVAIAVLTTYQIFLIWPIKPSHVIMTFICAVFLNHNIIRNPLRFLIVYVPFMEFFLFNRNINFLSSWGRQ